MLTLQQRKSNPLMLRQGRLVDGTIVDILIENSRIAAIDQKLPQQVNPEIQLNGKLISPPFVESHVHLDSALTAGEPRFNCKHY